MNPSEVYKGMELSEFCERCQDYHPAVVLASAGPYTTINRVGGCRDGDKAVILTSRIKPVEDE